MKGPSVALAVFCIFVLSSVTNVQSKATTQAEGGGGSDFGATVQGMIKEATAALQGGGEKAKEAWKNMISQGKQAMSKMDAQNKQNMQKFLDSIGTNSQSGMKKLKNFDFATMMKGDGGKKIGNAIKKGIAGLGELFGKKN